MKLFICCLALIASAQAFSFARDRDSNARILRSDADVYPDGSYSYGFEADNGIEAHESGIAGQSVSGSSKWVDNNGTPFELTYTADENGYRPQGAHLPVGPPIPDYILRALDYIKSHPNKNDPYAYVHQPDPVYETRVYQAKPAKPTYQPFAKPQTQVFKSSFAKPQTQVYKSSFAKPQTQVYKSSFTKPQTQVYKSSFTGFNKPQSNSGQYAFNRGQSATNRGQSSFNSGRF